MASIWTMTLLGCIAVASAQYPLFLGTVQPAVVNHAPIGYQPYYPQVHYQTVPAVVAKCVLEPASNSQVSGEIEFFQSSNSHVVSISGSLSGLSPGWHGFHLHQEGKTTNNCKDAGPHFNPFNQTHGGPQDEIKHAGDFGNIFADQYGHVALSLEIPFISLIEGTKTNALNHAIVVHALQDDLGKGGNAESLKTGNAGARLACCVVQQVNYK